MGELRSEMRGEMGELRSEMRGEMGELRGEMNDKFDRVYRELSQIKSTVGMVKIETSALIDAVADINKRQAGT